MKAWFAGIAVASAINVVPITAIAQSGPALAEARGRLVCGAGTLVSATYVGNGMLRVTCREPSSETQSSTTADTALTGTGLAAPIAAGVVATILIVAIAGGGDDEAGTTATTTTTGNGGAASR